MKNLKKLIFVMAFLLTASSSWAAADRVQKKDTNRDGRTDYWGYWRGTLLYKREWDRNFDGKADLRILVENRKLIEKQYDNNFDGKFEKIEKTPVGTTGQIQTSAPQR